MTLLAAEGTRLILIRHGQTEWNHSRRVQGHADPPLDALGRAQAGQVGRRFQGEPIAAVYASDLARAVETAQALATSHGLPVETSPAFREASYGLWEGLTVAEIEGRYPVEYRAWREDSLRSRAPEGESVEGLQQRALEGMAEIMAAGGGQRILLVSHGGTIRALVCGLLGWPLATHRQLRIDNASVTRIDYTPYGPMLVVYNDVCHLAAEIVAPAIG